MAKQLITPCLWFDGNAEEAVNFYVSIFRDSEIRSVVPGPSGSTLVVKFFLGGAEYMALNGGPHFRFNEAISLSVHCADQAEVDEYWAKLCPADAKGQCGWLKDKYGLSWQIVPAILPKLMGDPDPAKSKRVMDALMPMGKIDIAGLQRAYDGM